MFFYVELLDEDKMINGNQYHTAIIGSYKQPVLYKDIAVFKGCRLFKV